MVDESIIRRMSGVSVLDLGIAVVIFVAIVTIAFGRREQGRFEHRLRGILHKEEGRSTSGPMRANLSGFLHWLGLQIVVHKVWQTFVEWLWEHSSFGRKKHILLRQAGFRADRVYLYFEAVRLLFGVGLSLFTYLTLSIATVPIVTPVLAIVLIFLAMMVGLYLPEIYLKRRVRGRRDAFGAAWDDAIGLLIICLDAGLSIEVALRRIARELAATAPVLAEELIITVTDLAVLPERRLAYLNLSQRMDLPSVKSVTVALIQAERQGASISSSLRTISQANRQKRVSLAEERAAALGPKMTIPMIVFFLPIVFVIIIAPVALTANF